jgi:hypothetical protein
MTGVPDAVRARIMTEIAKALGGDRTGRRTAAIPPL